LLSDSLMDRVMDIRHTSENDRHLLERIAKSICPEIFGM